jgi:hypothetical protein
MPVEIRASRLPRARHSAVVILFVCLGLPHTLTAQGPVISFTPGAVIHTTAGNGAMFFSGDNGPATNAALAGPNALAMDAAGYLYIADSKNHRVRRVDASGNITTFAGSGTQGFLGDGGPATSASLDTPMSVAVNPINGTVYIADSRNNVIRAVAGGIISTFAGDSGGKAGYSGDGGPASGALLNCPRGVATDAAGNLYIADTNNHVIRMVSNGTVTTVGGNGQQGFFGDNGPATAASLDSPASVFVDSAGNIFIPDTRNHRIREVSGGQITTIAGNGAIGFLGEGTPALNAAMNYPLGVAKDSLGNIYIVDANNERVRRVNPSGTISTVVANGQQGFFGDNGPPLKSSLDTPSAVLPVGGHLLIADKGNQRIREVDTMLVSFADQIVGTTSTPQSVTVSNVGTATLTLTSVTLSTGAFALAGGSCGTAFPKALNAGSSCTLNIVFTPVGIGPNSSTLQFTDNAPGSPQSIPISGNGIQDGTTVVLGSSQSTTTFGESVTLTATIASSTATTAPPPTGNISFADGANVIGSSPVSAGSASFSTSTLTAGSHTITASYSGDSLYASSSTSLTQTVNKAAPTVVLAVQPDPIVPGKSANFTATVSSPAGVPSGSVTFTANNNPLGTSPLNSSGVATFTATLAAGPQAIVAVYNGDVNFAGASSPVLNEQSSGVALSIQPSNATIVSGQSATFSVSIAPSGGFTGSVALSCSNLPAAATCQFSPASLATNGSPVTSTLTLRTSTTAGSVGRLAPPNPSPPIFLFVVIFFALWLSLGLMPRPLPRSCAAAYAMLLSLTLLAIGCASGNGSRSGLGQTTPPGSYSVTVSASTSGPGAPSQSAVLSITVTP